MSYCCEGGFYVDLFLQINNNKLHSGSSVPSAEQEAEQEKQSEYFGKIGSILFG